MTGNAKRARAAWFDKLTMSAHPEPVEGCELRGLYVLLLLCAELARQLAKEIVRELSGGGFDEARAHGGVVGVRTLRGERLAPGNAVPQDVSVDERREHASAVRRHNARKRELHFTHCRIAGLQNCRKGRSRDFLPSHSAILKSCNLAISCARERPLDRASRI